jgi:hypothetical protein
MGIAAVGFFVLGMAADGVVWAGAASAVIVAGVVVAVIHATLFALVWTLSQGLVHLPSQRATVDDPFAKQAYPLPVPSLSERMGHAAALKRDDTPKPGCDDSTRDSADDDGLHD